MFTCDDLAFLESLVVEISKGVFCRDTVEGIACENLEWSRCFALIDIVVIFVDQSSILFHLIYKQR